MMNPRVSVIVTTHNRRDLVQRAIRSVLEQDYANFDLHIVDDASSDGTQVVLERLIRKRENVFYWRHDECRGLSAARNTGVTHCCGEYIAFLDDDDIWTPGSLKKRIDRLNQLSPEQIETLGVIHAGWNVHLVDENRIAYVPQHLSGRIKEYTINNKIVTMSGTCLYPKRVLEKIQGFDEAICSSVDHDIMMKLAVNEYHAVAIDEPLAILFLSRKNRTMVTDTRPRIKGVEQFLEKWTPTYIEWYGRKGAARFVNRYRTNVLGELSAKKLAQGDIVTAWLLLKHVIGRNRCSLAETSRLALFFARHITRKVTPKCLIAFVRGERKTRQLP